MIEILKSRNVEYVLDYNAVFIRQYQEKAKTVSASASASALST